MTAKIQTEKELRFRLIEKALLSVLDSLHMVVGQEALGLSDDDLEEYSKLKEKTKSSYEYLNFLANKMVEIYKRNTDEVFWTHYEKALLEADAEGSLEYRPKYERAHIDNAIQNAFYFFFGLYAILPKIYWNKFKKELDNETFKKLVLNSNKLAKAMSIIHFDMFRSFIYSSSQTKVGVATQLHNFYPDSFEISDELELSLSSAALTRARAHTAKLMEENKADISAEKPTIGCPAKFVKVDADRDLIDLSHEWIVKVINRYYL